MKQVAFVLCLVGCGGAMNPAGGSGGNGAGSGHVGLAVDSVDAPPTVGGVAPAPGRAWVTVALTLNNVDAASPVPAAQIYFTLATHAGLVLTAAAESAELAPPCAADTSLARGGMLACALAFEVPTTDAAATLDYDDHEGDGATAVVPTPSTPSAPACETVASWKNVDSNDCRSCAEAAEASGGPCIAAQQAFTNCAPAAFGTCDDACLMQTTDATALCTCEAKCAPGCDAQYEAYGRCFIAACASVCM